MSDEPKERPKRRRKLRKLDGEADGDVQPIEDSVDHQDPLTVKKKRKRRKKKAVGDLPQPTDQPIGIETELRDLNEDIVECDPNWQITNTKGQGTMKSELTDKIFIEKKSGFQSTTKAKLEKRERIDIINNRENVQAENHQKNTMDFAISTQKVIKMFSTFCIGLLGGVGFWHIMTSFIMYSDLTNDEFLKGSTRLASPGQSFYYLMFAICTISVCDRFDLGRPTSVCMLTHKSGVFAIIVYVIGLVISLSMAAIEQKMSAWNDKKDVWSTVKDRDDDLSLWLKLNTARGTMAIIGWFVISLQTRTDRLSDNLIIANEDIMNDMSMPSFEKNNVTSHGVTNRAFSSMA
ncbi:unnamed protein product [Dimorphilus gyrociliatus]|uniref:Uncharacterized protein n=1 Tax=Dimorphilus gyrociliatus TaxID=2664684 RepID=A0A7I8VYG5_9ANNE|nr:unnamed protein product [Dimorphilus gyrociliatus]